MLLKFVTSEHEDTLAAGKSEDVSELALHLDAGDFLMWNWKPSEIPVGRYRVVRVEWDFSNPNREARLSVTFTLEAVP